MFDKQYRFYGTHKDKVQELVAAFDEDSKASIFKRNLDVLLNAPIIGFLYQRKADENGKDGDDTSIFAEQMLSVAERLKYLMRVILLLDKEYEPDEEKRLDKAFREFGKNEKDLDLFNDYVRGGIDVLYEKIIEEASSPADYINRLYDFVDEFNGRFNDEITSNTILKQCPNIDG